MTTTSKRGRPALPPHPSPLATALRLAREAAGQTQAQVASAVGMRRGDSISRYEAGLSAPKLPTLLRLATHFGLSLDDLLMPKNS